MAKGDNVAKKSETLTDAEVAARRIESVRSSGYVSTYANNAGIAVSPWDFKFTFGVITEATKALLSVEQRVEVYMSPQHTKAFYDALKNNVEEYETSFGRIVDPVAALTGKHEE
jgi:hypothetical protein